MKISKDVFTILQYCVEQYIVNILRDANIIAIHSGRVKLMKSDIELMCTLKNISTSGFNDVQQNIKTLYFDKKIGKKIDKKIDKNIDIKIDNKHKNDTSELSDSSCEELIEEY